MCVCLYLYLYVCLYLYLCMCQHFLLNHKIPSEWHSHPSTLKRTLKRLPTPTSNRREISQPMKNHNFSGRWITEIGLFRLCICNISSAHLLRRNWWSDYYNVHTVRSKHIDQYFNGKNQKYHDFCAFDPSTIVCFLEGVL